MRYILLLLFPLAACDPSAPSHLPNPLELPFAAISNGISNSAYDAKRQKVSRYVTTNFGVLKTEIGHADHPHLTQAMNIAKIPASARPGLLQELQDNPDIYQTQNPEQLIIAIMVYGN